MDEEQLRSLVIDWLQEPYADTEWMKSQLLKVQSETISAARAVARAHLRKLIGQSRDARREALDTAASMKGTESSNIFGNAQRLSIHS